MKKETYKETICQVLEFTEQEYEDKLFNSAFEYLELNMHQDEYGINQLSQSAYFWEWWVQQWERRNKILNHIHKLDQVHRILSPADLRFLRERYRHTHSPERLNIYPNRVVMEYTFNQSVTNKNEVKK